MNEETDLKASGKNVRDTRDSTTRRFIPKPNWIVRLEKKVAGLFNLHPNLISAVKLFVITPLMVLAFEQIDIIPGGPYLIGALLALFLFLDYADGVVARNKGLTTQFGRIFDRVTDYPLLLFLSFYCAQILPLTPLLAKLGLDLILFAQFIYKKGTTENRLRSTISNSAVVSMLFISQGWASELITRELVGTILWVNAVFSLLVVLYNARILQKRFIADCLSMANLLCGVVSMYFAYLGRIEISIAFLILGAAFDGMDGAAARKFGGTRFGVYSDDIADAVNFGLAPGVALFFVIGGVEGAIVGASFTLFTWSRLVYFTLNKSFGDDNYFCGAPSTLGGLIVLCSLYLFNDHRVLLGLFIGIACVQMVSFDAHYRHLGRYASVHRKSFFGMVLFGLLLIAGAIFSSTTAAIGVLLAVCQIYGFLPTILNFKKLASARVNQSPAST